MQSNQDKQLPTIISLAALGLVFVVSVAFFSFVFDRSSKETTQPEVVEKEIEKTYDFDSEGYGIKVGDLSGWLIAADEFWPLDEITPIDCRKMSDVMRESVTGGEDQCYEVIFEKSGIDGYVSVAAGNAYHEDSDETYILPNPDSELREYPDSTVNLPLERIYVSDFPVNFNGVTIVYSSGSSFTFYKGIVYKGADKYAIMIKGDLNDDVKQLLGQMELE
ncbi:hypothetical protein JW978_04435 [Candidatus Dojkabacteria bacterium]|nr:hypothetical protein [Candidatus Dojkabacteria bacterium]